MVISRRFTLVLVLSRIICDVCLHNVLLGASVGDHGKTPTLIDKPFCLGNRVSQILKRVFPVRLEILFNNGMYKKFKPPLLKPRVPSTESKSEEPEAKRQKLEDVDPIPEPSKEIRKTPSVKLSGYRKPLLTLKNPTSTTGQATTSSDSDVNPNEGFYNVLWCVLQLNGLWKMGNSDRKIGGNIPLKSITSTERPLNHILTIQAQNI